MISHWLSKGGILDTVIYNEKSTWVVSSMHGCNRLMNHVIFPLCMTMSRLWHGLLDSSPPQIWYLVNSIHHFMAVTMWLCLYPDPRRNTVKTKARGNTTTIHHHWQWAHSPKFRAKKKDSNLCFLCLLAKLGCGPYSTFQSIYFYLPFLSHCKNPQKNGRGTTAVHLTQYRSSSNSC